MQLPSKRTTPSPSLSLLSSEREEEEDEEDLRRGARGDDEEGIRTIRVLFFFDRNLILVFSLSLCEYVTKVLLLLLYRSCCP
jgi:ABC-type microcin C transport system permease subunit YejB